MKTIGFMLHHLNTRLKTIDSALKLQKEKETLAYYSAQKTIVTELIGFVKSTDHLIIKQEV